MKHFDLIKKYCEVIAIKSNYAIFYKEGSFGYADIFIPGEGWVSYSCKDITEFNQLIEITR